MGLKPSQKSHSMEMLSHRTTGIALWLQPRRGISFSSQIVLFFAENSSVVPLKKRNNGKFSFIFFFNIENKTVSKEQQYSYTSPHPTLLFLLFTNMYILNIVLFFMGMNYIWKEKKNFKIH